MVGKALALLLAKERLRVALVQAPAAAQVQPDLRSYALNAASKNMLQTLKVWPQGDAALACPIAHMRVHEAGGAQLQFDAPPGADGAESALGYIVDASVLDAQLERALHYQSGIELVSESVAAPLTAICEGRDSSSRSEFGLAYEAYPYEQSAIAAHLHCERPHHNTAYQWFDAQGNVLALLPRNSDKKTGFEADNAATAASNTVALVWSLSSAQAQVHMDLDEAAFTAALEQACGQQLGSMTLQSARAAWPLRLAQAQHWCGQQAGKSWGLLGDAAHSMHPLAGQGLNLGFADALSLAQHLQAREYFRPVGDLRVLRRWERERKAQWQQMRLATDGLQRLFTHDHATVSAMRHWGMQAFNRLPPLKNRALARAMG